MIQSLNTPIMINKEDKNYLLKVEKANGYYDGRKEIVLQEIITVDKATEIMMIKKLANSK